MAFSFIVESVKTDPGAPSHDPMDTGAILLQIWPFCAELYPITRDAEMQPYPTYVTKKEGTALVDTIFLVSDIYFLGFLLCFTKLSRSLYTPGKRCIGSDHLGLLFLDRRGKWGRAYMGGISERAFLGHGVHLDSVKHSWRKWGKALGLICSIQYRGGREG